jgi:hypothetical protein
MARSSESAVFLSVHQPFQPEFHMIKVLVFFLSFSLTATAYAGTEIDILHDDQQRKIQVEGNQVRMKSSRHEYVLIQPDKSAIHTVNTQAGKVVTMDLSRLPKPSAFTLNAETRAQGRGPEIAGFPTMKYRYIVNGKDCGVIYASMDAYQNSDIQMLFIAMQSMVDSQLSMMGGFVAMMDACKLGDMALTRKADSIGLPMRTERNGRIVTEVKSIQGNIVFPQHLFDIPSEYLHSSIEQEMKNASPGMPDSEPQQQNNSQPPQAIQNPVQMIPAPGDPRRPVPYMMPRR